MVTPEPGGQTGQAEAEALLAGSPTAYSMGAARGIAVSSRPAISAAVVADIKHERGETMDYTIDSDKLAEVVRLFNQEVDPKATDDLVETQITADWNEGDEHQAWIDSATVQEIVDWLASFYD